MSERWDPIESAQAEADLLTAAHKKVINNILKSYVGVYDPFCELIQNAMDAVDTRERELDEQDYIKKIWISINLKDNIVSVTDNGIGFKENEFRTFLCPNISFKDEEKNRGNKGVGSTYLAYGFNHIQLGTKTSDYNFCGELKYGRKWVDDHKGIVTRPYVTKAALSHAAFNDIDRGSTFSIYFGGENTRPKDLNWIGANNAHQWLTILSIKTPLGQLNLDNNDRKPILFDIEVIDRNGKSTNISDCKAQYIYPHEVIKASIAIGDIIDYQQKLIDKQKDPSKLPGKYTNLNGVYFELSTDEIRAHFTNREDSELINMYKIAAYGYFCYTVKIWDGYNDKIAGLRKGMRILKGGLQLATNAMPQGELYTIPLTSNIGYQNQAHVIVHFVNADPDLGRKGFQPELQKLAEDISVYIVNNLKKWRWVLRKDTGGIPPIQDESVIYEWVKELEKHEEDNPMIINNNNFFLPLREISITSIPLSEQDVIVLFNQLVAGGVIRGIKLMATHSRKKYDGIFRYFVNYPLENHLFDKSNNPLGVEELHHHKDFLSRPYVMEYKYNVDDLIYEFENGEKNEQDIDLIVAWDIGNEWKKRYQITSLLELDNIQAREFHGQTHICLDGNTGEKRFYAIILSELIDYLNDVDGVQSVQKSLYENVI